MPRPSPLQNRSAPDGSLHAVAARGTLMGNRGGRLHRSDGTLGSARWRGPAWIACRLAFKGRRRSVMGAGYTEIFFLDEATALAAGHRPCFECRRTDALAFAAAWAEAYLLDTLPKAAAMDRLLHAQRRAAHDSLPIGDLPPGSIFAADELFWLRTPEGVQRWSFEGYGPAAREDPARTVQAVTPAASRAVLAAGYRPRLHPSADQSLSCR